MNEDIRIQKDPTSHLEVVRDPYCFPSLVSGLEDVVYVAAGWSHSLAIKSDGSVWGWDMDLFIQLTYSSLAN